MVRDMVFARCGTARMKVRTAPIATYRLQFNRNFTFADARRIVPYLKYLGISHVYASPLLKARAGSAHGYDIVDHDSLNPELGENTDFLAFLTALKSHGIGLILDIVPNHMGVWGNDNVWWLDILEHGEASPYATYFDIDWHPQNPTLKNKVLVPCLAEHYGAALESGNLHLRFDPGSGAFGVHYFQHLFPIDPRTYPQILAPVAASLARSPGADARALENIRALLRTCRGLPRRTELAHTRKHRRIQGAIQCKQALAELYEADRSVADLIDRELRVYRGTPNDPSSFDRLHRLLESQAYRLAYWLVATDEINYRRFFNINDLAGIRMEHHEVFTAAHRCVRRLLTNEHITGLRIDHPDGLSDPYRYLCDLRELIAQSTAGAPHRTDQTYLVVEKILTGNESLRTDWPVCGTTGYESASLINGLFIHPDAERALERTYSHFIGRSLEFRELLYGRKKLIMRTTLAGELTVLANLATTIARTDRRNRDFTYLGLRDALTEIIAWFPVYRTYLNGTRFSEVDSRYLESAILAAKERSRAKDILIFEYLGGLLTLRASKHYSARVRRQIVQLVLRFQQYTAPVMAKALEDTTFYIYNCLISQNDVGFDPRHFGISCENFHQANQRRLADWPHSMISTSTHDSKRSEDVRARINVLSELPDEWRRHVASWRRLNRRKMRFSDQRPAPSRNDEYFLYQTLIGTWPLGSLDEGCLSDYCERIVTYMIKAVNEARIYSSWINRNTDYEQSVRDFITALLRGPPRSPFLRDFLPFQERIAEFGMYNSLSQTLLKLTIPGVPDIYQGNDLWTFRLADPDNRQLVDFDRRDSALSALHHDASRNCDGRTSLTELRTHIADGRLKLYLTWRALQLRHAQPRAFTDGDYRGLTASGPHAEHICAFARLHKNERVIIVVARWLARLTTGFPERVKDPDLWRDTWVQCPSDVAQGPYRNVLDGEAIPVLRRDNSFGFDVQLLFKQLPVALLTNR